MASRDELLAQNLRLVHHVARQVARSSRADIEFEDLVSALRHDLGRLGTKLRRVTNDDD